MITTTMTNAEYHAHDSVSKSGLDLIARSPAHYRYQPPRERTRHLEIGTAVHAAILEPESFERDYLLLQDAADRRCSTYKQAAAARGGEYVLTSIEADYVVGMAESVRSHKHAGKRLAKPGRAELSVITTDPVTGVAVRCRFDYLTDSGIPVDIKTARDARADAFSRAVHTYRYHTQAAFYADVWKWETGETLDRMEFIAVESSLPHAVMVHILDDEALQEGRRLYREALNTYARCLDSGHWPAYADDAQYLCLPPWAVESDDDGEIYE